MEKEVDAFSAILDEENNDNVVLYNGNNEPVEFEQIAIVPLNGKDYVILKPVEEFEGVGEDEALVFRFDTNEEGEDILSIEADDATIDAVFDVYYKLLEEARNNQ